MANKYYYPMVDAYPQIYEALMAAFFYGHKLQKVVNISESWPRSAVKAPLIVLSELTNQNTRTSCVDELAFQVDIWAESSDDLRTMADTVDETLCSIGFRRTMASPADNSNGFRRIFRYGRRVDKRSMRLID